MLDIEAIKVLASGERFRQCTDENQDGEFECPRCGSSYFGASRIMGNNSNDWDYNCHDEYERGCSWSGSRDECFYYTYTKQDLAKEILELHNKIQELENK
jgi:hypothetical protein